MRGVAEWTQVAVLVGGLLLVWLARWFARSVFANVVPAAHGLQTQARVVATPASCSSVATVPAVAATLAARWLAFVA